MPGDSRGLLSGLVKDGRPLLALTGISLVLSGGFALFLSLTGEFLPHDVRFLGMEAAELCEIHDCRIVYFMFHDRVAFGGALIALGLLYLWLVEFPLGRGEPWAWWALTASGVTGFGSFLSWLGYGYLDTWHGAATLFLLPLFAVGLVITRLRLDGPAPPTSLFVPSIRPRWRSAAGVGRLLLLGTGAGMLLGGGTIMVVGMTNVFVPQDLVYMGMSAAELETLNPNLVPLIAHDRAGFGGAICTTGLLVLLCVWCGRPSRSLWQTLALAGGSGFACAIGVHFAVGYMDFSHLAPAYAGTAIFVAGLALTFRPMHRE